MRGRTVRIGPGGEWPEDEERKSGDNEPIKLGPAGASPTGPMLRRHAGGCRRSRCQGPHRARTYQTSPTLPIGGYPVKPDSCGEGARAGGCVHLCGSLPTTRHQHRGRHRARTGAPFALPSRQTDGEVIAGAIAVVCYLITSVDDAHFGRACRKGSGGCSRQGASENGPTNCLEAQNGLTDHHTLRGAVRTAVIAEKSPTESRT